MIERQLITQRRLILLGRLRCPKCKWKWVYTTILPQIQPELPRKLKSFVPGFSPGLGALQSMSSDTLISVGEGRHYYRQVIK